jgi:serine/threonine protein kinase
MASTGASDPTATARPCPYCGLTVNGPHDACTKLFKSIMSEPAESALDEVPPEVGEYLDDESRRLGDYVLVDQIGRGGMGTVWKAWDRKLTRWVAVKFLNGQDADDLARFSREAKLAARLRHPNIAAVFDTGEVPSKQAGQDAVRYLAMELIDGQSVASAELPLPKWLEIFARVARAVDHAHQSGVVHRDLKPSNLMLTKENWPYVMDFGLAKSLKAGSSVSISGVVLGTPAYMPPEQASGKLRETDQQSDVYSLGATLYFVLTRSEPYRGEDSMEVLIKVLQTEPRRPREIKPDLPKAVEAVILKAMARNKSDRYPSAGAMAEDLERLLAPEAGALQLPRRRSSLPMLTSICGALILGLAVLVWRHSAAPPPASLPAVTNPAPVEKPSPLPGFLARIRELKDQKRWREARAWVDEGGSFLGAAERSEYAREIEELCRNELRKITSAFCSGILTERLESVPPGFRFLTLAAELPQADQLLLPDPAFDWTRGILPKLDEARAEALLQAAAESVRLDEVGENPWFSVAELAASRALLRELAKQTQKVVGAARAAVREARAAAESIAAPWDALLRDLNPAFRRRHASRIDAHDAAIRQAREAFPGDPPWLRSIDLGKILNGADAERQLEELERRLLAQNGAGALTRESQQSLLVTLVTTRALSCSFRGETADEIARDLQSFAATLKTLGVGKEDRSRFGPKVEAVFDLLLR